MERSIPFGKILLHSHSMFENFREGFKSMFHGNSELREFFVTSEAYGVCFSYLHSFFITAS